MKKVCLVAGLAAALLATSAQATLTVTENGVGPGTTLTITSDWPGYNGGALAGIYNLTVNGVATPSFCIDVSRFSPGAPTQYDYISLDKAPLTPAGPMGAVVATDIRKLWAAYFTDAKADNTGLQAAALQAAIWMDVGTQFLHTTVSGNDAVVARANEMIASLPQLSAEADLMGLVNGTTQNYVVPVPEPTTVLAGALLLLPFGASTLRGLRRKA